MGLQSFSYYVAVSWFPSVLQDMGYTPGAAGWIVTFFQVVSGPRDAAMPTLIRRSA